MPLPKQEAKLVYDSSEVDLWKLLEDRRLESERRDQVLHGRISELRDDLSEKIDSSHKDIMVEMKGMRKEQQEHAKEMSERVGRLEKWKWTVVGAAAAVIFLVFGGHEVALSLLK